MALDIQRNIRHFHVINSVVLGHVSLLSTSPLAARRYSFPTSAAASAIWHLKSSLLSSYESSNITVSISSHKNGNNTLLQCPRLTWHLPLQDTCTLWHGCCCCCYYFYCGQNQTPTEWTLMTKNVGDGRAGQQIIKIIIPRNHHTLRRQLSHSFVVAPPSAWSLTINSTSVSRPRISRALIFICIVDSAPDTGARPPPCRSMLLQRDNHT